MRGRLIGAALSAVLGVAMLPWQSNAQDPSPDAAAAAAEAVSIDDAVFTWGVSRQSNAQSHNPAAINFLSAGVADPGAGGDSLASHEWKASEGNVSVQKRDAAGAWQPAAWAGLGTDAAGNAIGMYGPFSDHRVRIGAGVGTIDPATDTASVSWTGTFTVVYYGGNTVFHLTNPTLTLANGAGQLRATAGGFSADRNDPLLWVPMTPVEVPVVTLSGVDVTENGFQTTPDYRGVAVEALQPQVRTGEDWGSFPQEFVNFLAPTGGQEFWYSTGLQTNWTKLPEPLDIGWAGREPGGPEPTESAKPKPKPTNDIKKPPKKKPTARPTPTQRPAVPPVVEPSAPAPPVPTVEPLAVPSPAVVPSAPAAASAFGALPPVQLSAAPVEPSNGPLAETDARGWWIGGALLLAAALLLLVPAPRRRL